MNDEPRANTQPNRPDSTSSMQQRIDWRVYRHATSLDSCVNEAARHELISIAAYYKAEQRGFAPGRQLEDWLAAEAEFDRSIQGS